MQYPKRKQNQHKAVLTGIGIVGGALVLAVVAWNIAHHAPLYRDVVATSVETRKTLEKKVTALQTTIDSYASVEAQLAVLQSENSQLKAELGRSDHPKGILATTLFAPGNTLYDTFVIDAGSDQGIVLGQTAYAFGSVALGTVSAVQQHTATVLLSSDPGRETSATVVGSNTAVTLIGRGAGEYEVHMPRDVKFSVGDTIQYESTVPHILATIQEVTSDPRDPFQRLLAKAPVNLQNLKWVIVE
jgi:cell shape-determining protein MreC